MGRSWSGPSVTAPVRVGTRRSPLARAQTDLVIGWLSRAAPGRSFEAVPITTDGDRIRGSAVPLDFTDAIDGALDAGEVDLAVHSAKDLPGRLRATVRIVAVPPREDPRDCLVLWKPGTLRTLPPGARLGSSSLRRRAQLLRARPDVVVTDLRGNVDSRIARVRAHELDGALLAAAGVRRLGRAADIAAMLDTRRFLPPPGQGTLALVARRDDRGMTRLAATIDHAPSRSALVAERAFSLGVGGDCNLPLGALAAFHGTSLLLRAEILTPQGTNTWTDRVAGAATRAAPLGRELARRARDSGAAERLAIRTGP